MHSKRIGRFSISRDLVERDEATVRAVMGRCVIVRCEMMFHRDGFEYTAISPDFDEVPHGYVIPEYDVHIRDNGERIEFVRHNAEVSGERSESDGLSS